jgi:hypothetical protein
MAAIMVLQSIARYVDRYLECNWQQACEPYLAPKASAAKYEAK